MSNFVLLYDKADNLEQSMTSGELSLSMNM